MEQAKRKVDRRTAGTMIGVRLLHEWYLDRMLNRPPRKDPLRPAKESQPVVVARKRYEKYIKPKERKKPEPQKAYVIHKEKLP